MSTADLHPAEVCPICRHPLRYMGARLAWVRGFPYHAACYVLLGAPSAAASGPFSARMASRN